MFNWLKWFKQKKVEKGSVFELRIRLPKSSLDRLNMILDQSSHQNLEKLLGEAFLVSETIYKQSGEMKKDVTCCIQGRKICMYVEGGGGGGESILVDNSNVIELFKKAA